MTKINKPWTSGEIWRLRRLIEEYGMSPRHAADVLGRTRNSVIGCASRNGIKLTPNAGGRQPKTAVKKAGAIHDDQRVTATVSSSSDAVSAILGLSWGFCRWPIGDPHSSGFRFCCEPTGGAASYCIEHAERSRRGAEERFSDAQKRLAAQSMNRALAAKGLL